MGKIKKKIMINAMLLILGCLLISLTFNIFCVPNKIVPGGLSGVGIIFDHLFGIKTSYVLLIGNIVLVTIGIICLGLKDTIPSIIGAVVYTLVMYLTELLNVTITLSSPFLNIITIGVLFGIGCTMVYLSGCSLGGLDIMGVIFNKKIRSNSRNSPIHSKRHSLNCRHIYIRCRNAYNFTNYKIYWKQNNR